MKLLVAGVVGGVILFLWNFVWHTQLPFGMTEHQNMAPDKEAAVIEHMRGAMGGARSTCSGLDLSDPRRPWRASPTNARPAGPQG